MDPDNEYFEYVARELEASAAAIRAAEDDALEGPEDGPATCVVCGDACVCATIDAADYRLDVARGK
jgi:hypothetical protein